MKKTELLKMLLNTMKKSSLQDRPKLARLINQVERADERYLDVVWSKWETLKKSADSKKVK